MCRIVLSILLSGAIGLQREIEHHPAGIFLHLKLIAGLRTHIMVSLGATIFTLISSFGFLEQERQANTTFDPTRIAAQSTSKYNNFLQSVVSGIGFLGGGAIIKVGTDVRGLTSILLLCAMLTSSCCFALGSSSYWNGCSSELLVSCEICLDDEGMLH